MLKSYREVVVVVVASRILVSAQALFTVTEPESEPDIMKHLCRQILNRGDCPNDRPLLYKRSTDTERDTKAQAAAFSFW